MPDAGCSPLHLLLDDRASRDGACGSGRRLEQRALELRDLQGHGAGLHGQVPLVMARPVRPPLPGTLVPGRAGALVGLKRPASRSTAPRPSGTPIDPASSRACSHRPVESNPAWFRRLFP